MLFARLVENANIVVDGAVHTQNKKTSASTHFRRKQKGGAVVWLVIYSAISYFHLKAIEHPVRTNQIPRQIPEQSFYTKPLPGIIMGGILPFGCIFIQLFFILNSIW